MDDICGHIPGSKERSQGPQQNLDINYNKGMSYMVRDFKREDGLIVLVLIWIKSDTEFKRNSTPVIVECLDNESYFALIGAQMVWVQGSRPKTLVIDIKLEEDDINLPVDLGTPMSILTG